MSRSADEWFDLYSESHRNPTNKSIHWICIPLIMLSLMGMLWSVPSPFSAWWLNWATIATALSLVFYARLSPTLAAGMAAVSAGIFAGVFVLMSLPFPLWATSAFIFVSAWIGQFIGHKIEGKKPSFFVDLQFLLIGPLWLLGHIYRRLGVPY